MPRFVTGRVIRRYALTSAPAGVTPRGDTEYDPFRRAARVGSGSENATALFQMGQSVVVVSD